MGGPDLSWLASARETEMINQKPANLARQQRSVRTLIDLHD